MAFTVAVIVTLVALAQKQPVVWVSYLPLAPLALLMFAGLYLFVLPYATRWRGARRAASTGSRRLADRPTLPGQNRLDPSGRRDACGIFRIPRE